MDLSQGEFKLLLVEENGHIQQRMEEILGGSYGLCFASNGAQFWAVLEEELPDLILLSISLPDCSGFDLLKQLKSKEETKELPVIILIEREEQEAAERGFLLGAVDYIRKPIQDEVILLKARVRTQIRILEQVKKIERLGLVDTATGVSNRHFFDNQLGYEWSRAVREQQPISLLLIDVAYANSPSRENRKDRAEQLRFWAQSLGTCVTRKVDIFCRFEKERFAALLPGTGEEGAQVVAQRLKNRVKEIEQSQLGNEHHVGIVSVGWASAQPKQGDAHSQLLRRTEHALQKAKEALA